MQFDVLPNASAERKGSIVGLMLGTLLIAIGFLTIVMPISDFVLISRLRMDPGLPPFEQWVKPKPEVRLSVYIFGVENADAFLNGTDAALRLTEIGPVVYREHLHHTHIVRHENSTLSYTAERHLEFLPDQNEPGILNRTILVPNFVVLATAAFINDDYFKKFGFKFMLRESDTMFVNITVYDYLWNYRSDLIGRIRTFAPFLVPTDNSGVLYQVSAFLPFDYCNMLIAADECCSVSSVSLRLRSTTISTIAITSASGRSTRAINSSR